MLNKASQPIARQGIDLPRRRAIQGVLALAAGAALPARSQADGPLRIGRADYRSPLSEIEELVLSHAFERLGIRHEFVRLPLLRLLEMANEGQLDGDIGRIRDVAERYANLRLVPTPICQADVAMYGRSPGFDKLSRADIASLRIGIVRGVFLLSKHTRAMNVVEAQNFESMAAMLAGGRIDAVAGIYLDMEVQIQSGNVPGLVRWPYPWASEPLHLLLHKRLAPLIPRLDATLQEMAASGLTKRYYGETLNRQQIPPLLPEPQART
ncbi:ABC transporter substrate-binding protein [Pseudorhodoferax sp. Leaf274]|uniref:substrate-binding periplasmic protein n=1 Tax=Pseudorhodoferax sp. Leaf274 TaxID=1736318 RepID=UPI0007038437|nr:transporter substrate-binding domain-containing protein [Pseudorhodoferax sp. Leaf274]KQP38892.1 hypothetical protein ASF44_10640 [Pseudorhodoferax sp. Leaf274]